jgi:hypothetical protein
MKPSVVVAVVLAICVYLAPWCEGQKSPNPDTKNTGADNKKGHPPAVSIPYEIQNQWIETEGSGGKKESPPWYKSPVWLLVIVGVIAFSVVAWQSWETRRSVSAIINGQRAWIVVDKFGAPNVDEGISETGILFLVVNLKVVGATTAKLLGTGMRFHLVRRRGDIEDSVEPEPMLPSKPNYTGSFVSLRARNLPRAGFAKAPNEDFQIPMHLEDGPLSQNDLTAIRNKELFLCAYGFVTYEDSFKRKHETRFCYIYRVSYRSAIHTVTGKNVFPSAFELGGPEAYHLYT